MAYEGSIELISGITPKNGQNFPLVDAKDVRVDDYTRLSDILADGQKTNKFQLREGNPQTVSGVTYTAGDGTISLSGTASGTSYRLVDTNYTISTNDTPLVIGLKANTTYSLGCSLVSGEVSGGSLTVGLVRVYRNDNKSVLASLNISQIGDTITYTPAEDIDVNLGVTAISSRVYNNLVIRPYFYDETDSIKPVYQVIDEEVSSITNDLTQLSQDVDSGFERIENNIEHNFLINDSNTDSFYFTTESESTTAGVSYKAHNNGYIVLNGTASAMAYRCITTDGGIGVADSAKTFHLNGGSTYKIWFDYVSGTFTGATGVPMIRVLKEADKSTLSSVLVGQPDKCFYYTPENDIDVILSVWVANTRVYNNYTISPHFVPMAKLTSSRIDPHVVLSLFNSVGVIGDSFASGSTSYNGGKLNYNISWLQIMARKYGFTAENYSAGALTTYSWLYSSSKGLSLLQSSDWKQLYFIALGINDSNPNTDTTKNPVNVPLGTITDFNNTSYSPASGTTGTFYGNMGRIYRAVKQKNSTAVVCYITIPRFDTTTVRYAPYDEAIRAIANTTSSLLVDCSRMPLFRSDWWLSNQSEYHPTAPMYAAMAEAIAEGFAIAAMKDIDRITEYNGYLNGTPASGTPDDDIGE